MWEAYEKAQRGLRQIALAYDSVVESAVSAVAKRCKWPQDRTKRLRENASKQLWEIIARHAQDDATLAHLEEFALRQICVYLIEQEESRLWLRAICEERGRPYHAKDKELLGELRESAVASAMKDIANFRTSADVIVWRSANLFEQWQHVRDAYHPKHQLVDSLLNDVSVKKLVDNFTSAMVKKMKWVAKDDIKCLAKEGIHRAIYRWDPSLREFATAASLWMTKYFWSGIDRKGVPQDKFELIGRIWREKDLLVQKAFGRKPTDAEIAEVISSGGQSVTTEQVIEAREIAATMGYRSLNEMDEQLATDRGDDSAEQLDDGLLARKAAGMAPAEFSDPFEVRATVEEIERRLKNLPRSEWLAFWLDTVGQKNGQDPKDFEAIGVPSEAVVRLTERPAILNRLVKRVHILLLSSSLNELVRWLPRNVSPVFVEVALKGRGRLLVAREQGLNEEEITRRLKDAWRMLALLAALVVRKAQARANEIPFPPRKIFKEIVALLDLSPDKREEKIRDWLEERPVNEYRSIPVTDHYLNGLKRSLLEVSVEHLPESEKQAHLLYHLEEESLDEIAEMRKISHEVTQRLLQRSGLLADPPADLIDCLPDRERDVFTQIDVNGHRADHVAIALKLEEQSVSELLNTARRLLVLLAAISVKPVAANAPIKSPLISWPLLAEEIRALRQIAESERRRKIQCEIEERPLAEFQGMDDIQDVQLGGVLTRLDLLLAPEPEAPNPTNAPKTTQESKGVI